MSELKKAKWFGFSVGFFCLVYSIVVFLRYFLRFVPEPILDVLTLVMACGSAAFAIVIIWLHKTRNRSLGDPLMRQCQFALVWTLLMSLQFGIYSYTWMLARLIALVTIGMSAMFLLHQIRFWRTQQH